MYAKSLLTIIGLLFAVTLSPVQAAPISGDTNGDGILSFLDLITVPQKYAQIPTFPFQDQYFDGKFNSFDAATVIRQLIAPTSTPIPTATLTPTRTPTPTPSPTSILTPTPTITSDFANLSASLYGTYATFRFTPKTPSSMYYIDLSLSSDMYTGTYPNIGQGSSPITIYNPTKWASYTCGTKVYWTVHVLGGVQSPVQQSTINCTSPTPTVAPFVVNPVKVMVIDFNPIIESQGNKRIRDVYGWQDPLTLEAGFINDAKTLSNNSLQYTIVNRVTNVDYIPVLKDGFQYTDQTYMTMMQNQDTHHMPEFANYLKILNDFGVCDKVNAGQVDELWLWGGPWFGFYEAIMTGTGAFNTNGGPLTGSTCNRKLNIMGFSYERGNSEMLEDLGHRTEGTMSFLFSEYPIWTHTTTTAWGKYVKDCGWMHYAPNSVIDYDWSNSSSVTSACNDWLTYPSFTGRTDAITCSVWSCDGYLYKKWWFNHLPKAAGRSGNYWNNWWNYIVDFDRANSLP